MIRGAYDWNTRFPDGSGSLDLLFFFSGHQRRPRRRPDPAVELDRRLAAALPLRADRARPDLKPPAGEFNLARRIDTRLVDPLARAARRVVRRGPRPTAGTIRANLAFRNLVRARMLRLASGQQMAALLRSQGRARHHADQGAAARRRRRPGSAQLDALTDGAARAFLADTPLWFYVLREAELNDGRLDRGRARLVAETFHRAMEGSSHSIVRSPGFRPNLGEKDGRFRMADLLLFAFEGQEALLAPLGD